MNTILIFYLIITIWAGLFTIGDMHNHANTPRAICNINNFNLLAASLLWVVSFIINPWYYVCCFLYWLFHIRFD